MSWQIWWKIHVSQDRPFIPQLILEFPDFKSLVNGYLNNGLDILVSHINMHLFQLFVDKVRWSVMQYKISLTNVLWSPKDGPTIWLWKKDVGWAKLPWQGFRYLVPFRPIWGIDELRVGERERFISSRISKYVEFWKLGMSKDDLYVKVKGPYVKYFKNILELLSRPIP